MWRMQAKLNVWVPDCYREGSLIQELSRDDLIAVAYHGWRELIEGRPGE